ncbi:MAG: hypothetical protein IKH69_02420 [Bacteroidaceae bacterium]|nr:hypothetical protein [Bacteroidaceae bacterium]
MLIVVQHGEHEAVGGMGDEGFVMCLDSKELMVHLRSLVPLRAVCLQGFQQCDGTIGLHRGQAVCHQKLRWVNRPSMA